MSQLADTIRQAYEADQARGFTPVHDAAIELPKSYDEITTAWLTSALCTQLPTQGEAPQVLSFALGAVDNGSSNRRRITIKYNAAGQDAGLPEKVFCKATQDLTNRMVLGISGGVKCEVDFYAYVRPHIEFEAPRAYYAKFDPTTFNSLIMLGDLSDTVESFCDDKTPMNWRRAESQMRLLARVHGRSYSQPEITCNLHHFVTWPEYFERTIGFGMESGTKNGVAKSRDVMPERLRSVTPDSMWALMTASVERHRHLPQTFMHGDVHLKNWYVAGDDQMGLGDWQCCSRGHWSRDIAYTIATALQVEDRRAWETDLLKLYLEELQSNGGPACSFDEARLNYRQQLLTAFTWWAVTLCPPEGLPDMQPQGTTLEFLRRITTAMDDLDSIAAFS